MQTTTAIALSIPPVRLPTHIEADPHALDVPELRLHDHASHQPNGVIDLATVRARFVRTLLDTKPADEQVRLNQLHVQVEANGATLAHIVPETRARLGGRLRFGHYGWLDVCSEVLPSHGRKMIESLARLGVEGRGATVASAAMLLHLQAAGDRVVNLRTLYSTRDGSRLVRAITSPSYLPFDEVELVEALLGVRGLAAARVLQFQDSDVMTRIRLMVGGPEKIDTEIPVPVIELSTNKVGRGAVTASAGMYRFRCTNGMGGFEPGQKAHYSWHHSGYKHRICSGIAGAIEELQAVASGHVEGYKRALDVYVDGIGDWLREHTADLLTEKQQERAVQLLDDATTTAGDRLASVVDAISRAAQVEERLETAGAVESAALKVLQRGLNAADRVSGRLVGMPSNRRRK